MLELLEKLLTDTAGQGLGWMLSVISWIVTGFLFWLFRKREAQLVDQVSTSKDAHLNDVKEISRETTEAIAEMNKAHIEALKEATGAMAGLREIANSTKQTVEYILKGRGSQ